MGDYMLASSLKHAAHSGMLELVELVARLGQELSEGEIIQLANTSNRDFSEEIYFDVIRKKQPHCLRQVLRVGQCLFMQPETVRNGSSFRRNDWSGFSD